MSWLDIDKSIEQKRLGRIEAHVTPAVYNSGWGKRVLADRSVLWPVVVVCLVMCCWHSLGVSVASSCPRAKRDQFPPHHAFLPLARLIRRWWQLCDKQISPYCHIGVFTVVQCCRQSRWNRGLMRYKRLKNVCCNDRQFLTHETLIIFTLIDRLSLLGLSK